MGYCAAFGCKSNSKLKKDTANVSFHVFPQDPKRRKTWILYCGRFDFQPSKYSTLCSRHFSRKSYRSDIEFKHRFNYGIVHPQLTATAVPDIPLVDPGTPRPSTDKHLRARKRPRTETNHQQERSACRRRLAVLRKCCPEFQANSEPSADNTTNVNQESENFNVTNNKLENERGKEENSLPRKDKDAHRSGDVNDSEWELPPTKKARTGVTRSTTSSKSKKATIENDGTGPRLFMFNKSAASIEIMTVTERRKFEEFVACHNDVFGTVTTSLRDRKRKLRTWNKIAHDLAGIKPRTTPWTAEELMMMWSRKLFVDNITFKTVKIRTCENEAPGQLLQCLPDGDHEDQPSLQQVKTQGKVNASSSLSDLSSDVAPKKNPLQSMPDSAVFGSGSSLCLRQNARATVKCADCNKPRVVYSKIQWSQSDAASLSVLLSECEYTCGSQLALPPGHALSKSVVVRKNLCCAHCVEPVYYSTVNEIGRKDICSHCAREGVVADFALKQFYRTVLPICDDCKSSGKLPLVRQLYSRSRKKGRGLTVKHVQIPLQFSEGLMPQEDVVCEGQIKTHGGVVDGGPSQKQAANVNELWRAIADKHKKEKKEALLKEKEAASLKVKKPAPLKVKTAAPLKVKDMLRMRRLQAQKDPSGAKVVKTSEIPERVTADEPVEIEVKNTESGESEIIHIMVQPTDESKEPELLEIESQDETDAEKDSQDKRDAEMVSKDERDAEKESQDEDDVEMISQDEGDDEIESQDESDAETVSLYESDAEVDSQHEDDAEMVSQDEQDAYLDIVLPSDCEKLELDDRSFIIIPNEFPTSGDDFVRIKKELAQDTHLSRIQTQTVQGYIVDHLKKVTGTRYVLEMDACDWTFLYDIVHKVDRSCKHRLSSLKVRVSKMIEVFNDRIRGSLGS